MKITRTFIILAIALSLVFPASAIAIVPAKQAGQAVPNATVDFTILHTNDFHGNLEPAGSNPGMARVAHVVNQVRAEVGEENVVLLDAGDHMQGSLLSNLLQGVPTVDVYNTMGYFALTPGNHEFDWGQEVLRDRALQADYDFLSANLTVDDTGDCATGGWEPADFVIPWTTATVGTGDDTVTIGIIGITSVETPYITIAEATEGLCFKDPAESVLHYYDEVAAASDVIVLLTHIGYYDGGYGYGITVYGDQTLATMLNDAGKPVDLIIGGHSHTNLTEPTIIGDTLVVQAYYAGRRVGRADFSFDTVSGDFTVSWESLVVATDGDQDPIIDALIDSYANDPDYQELINTVIGFTNDSLTRNYEGDQTMGAFIQDAIYWDLNTDGNPDSDADMVFNNPGGIRADIVVTGTLPYTLTYGMLYSVLPFGNQTIVGDMTGAQIVELLNQSATLFKGALQPGGLRYSFFHYRETEAWSTPTAWGAFDIEVFDRDSETWEPLDLEHTYRVATNEFLAPAGQDGFIPFKYMTNISYWGDMLDGVNRWVAANYTVDDPYEAVLDGRINRVGDNETGPVIPVNILHNNDSHGRLSKTSYVGYTQLATLVKQIRAHNPDRTLLLNAGDQIQGDSMMYYFKDAPTGYAADGTELPDELTLHPMMAVMNALGYDAMTVGNHEYNFGNQVFTSVLGQAEFAMLQANVTDTGEYGIADVPVEPYATFLVGPEEISIAVLGIGNHRVDRYELPSNIVGLEFQNPIETAQDLAPGLKAANDAVIALTHIGFTQNPASIEVDENVDTVLAAETPGVDIVIGGHSHTSPVTGFGPYKYLPTVIAGPGNTPVIVTQAQRYNAFLGEVVLGFVDDGEGGYELVSRAGRYHAVTMETEEDPEIKAIVDPYLALLEVYNNTEIGQTSVPIDARTAYTEETNAANLQADAAVWELGQQGIEVDFHLSGAMTNGFVAETATITDPVTLKVADMFSLMPYENSLVVLELNGPQLKQILERAYRNYYYYKYVEGRGGYSYYTTCMLAINSSDNQVFYRDTYMDLPTGDNVVGLKIGDTFVDFEDDETYYNVSTVNYLAAGSCNFSDEGETIWPLDQIIHDTQYYVRDSVIKYIDAQEDIIAPAIEGRLVFQDMFAFMPILFQALVEE
jgi:2',3'-cyclic-nucleotide 2'-phosphodiesterase (5'-nucleotidase family)